MFICSLLCTGSQLRELDTFMQYYWKLAPQMRFIDADMLCFSYFDADIITDNDMRFIRHYKRTPRVCKQEIILIRMTDHLLSGNINLFYEMLEILQICGNPIIDHLVREIHVSLGYKFSTGSYICYSYITTMNVISVLIHKTLRHSPRSSVNNTDIIRVLVI